MRITKLIAKNIGPIFTAMGRKYIEIDLTGQKNRIILLIGTNGSGKTTILSLLNPDPYPGSFDVRGGQGFILEGEEGYKEIHYDHNGSKYVIKHFYMQNSGKGIKSFISKNGEELNTNGNSRSFKEIVEVELSIEPELFRLLRLGSNVAGFIDMKATERKNFMSDLLKDINVYLQLHKKITDDSRTIKSILKSVSDKITKLRVFNETEEKQNMAQLGLKLNDIKTHRDVVNGENGKLQGIIDTLIPEGLDNFILEVKSLDREFGTLSSTLRDNRDKLKDLFLVIEGDLEDNIKDIIEKIQSNENSVVINKSKIEFFFNQLNSLNKQKEEREGNLKYISSELQYDKLNQHYLELNRQKDKLSAKFKDFNPMCTKEEMLRTMSIFQEIERIILTIYDYSTSSVREVVDLFLDGQRVDNHVKDAVTGIDRKLTKAYSEVNRTGVHTANQDKVYVLYVPHEANCDCPYKKFYEDTKAIPDKESHAAQLRSEIEGLENERDRYLSYQDITKKIDFIFMIIKTSKDLVEKMPEQFFNIKTILNHIKGLRPVYDEDYITNYITALEEYEEYQSLDVRIKEAKKELQFIEKNSTSLTSMQNEIKAIDDQIFSTEEELETLRSENSELEKCNIRLDSILIKCKKYQGYKVRISEIEDEMKTTSKLLEEKNLTRDRIQEYLIGIRTNSDTIRTLDREIGEIESDITNINFRLREFKSLTEEKKILEEKFDDIDIIREALSSTKGIPLLFIQLYLKNTKSMVNQLLESVYGDTLEITDFVINDKEFRIPYIKKGITVQDAVHCSQGERTFVSLAISFALIEQSLREYNIMLLDEIDSTLHASLRGEFISIFERQLDIIEAEQAFVISHNNMFDSYPVDVIMTSDESIENYRNVNILWMAV